MGTQGGGANPPLGTWRTRDLSTAAYVHMSGLELESIEHVEHKKFLFSFRDPAGRGPRLQVEYLNSACRRFDESVRALKLACYDHPTSGDRRGG